jgi:hypothetical protein
MLGPRRDRVRKILAEDALEGLSVTGPVQTAQHVVQRPVLEHHDDHVIERVAPTLTCHRGLLIFRRERPAGPYPASLAPVLGLIGST